MRTARRIALNLALEHHTAEPGLAAVGGKPDLPRFHVKSVQANLQIANGDYLLLTSWTPTGNPEHADDDATHVVFAHASIQRMAPNCREP
jgi:hypothetical protein